VCGGLLLGGHLFGHVSDWSAQVIGGADCNAQDALLTSDCVQVGMERCEDDVSKCNQASGNATKICQTDAGGNACVSNRCSDDKHDTLDANGADGNPCTPTQS